MNIKKQLRNLYLYEIISGFQIVDAVWVLFLLERGFSIAQAGAAEGFFHVVSMCCEIPSGMLSDMIGRRKTLILSGIVSAAGSFCTIASDSFWVILLAMGLNAFSYNLVSGTREAGKGKEEGKPDFCRRKKRTYVIYGTECGISEKESSGLQAHDAWRACPGRMLCSKYDASGASCFLWAKSRMGWNSAFVYFSFQYGRGSSGRKNRADTIKKINARRQSDSRGFYSRKQQFGDCSFCTCGRYGTRSRGSTDASHGK